MHIVTRQAVSSGENAPGLTIVTGDALAADTHPEISVEVYHPSVTD
jgi:hypothetical protein